jgi:predicted glycosyltransferase
MFVGREKDLTLDLLRSFDLPHQIPPSRRYGPGMRGDALEFVARTRWIRSAIRRWKPHVLLTRNPTGVVAGAGTRTWTIFDTDDGRTVGVHYWSARPFADVITSSSHDPEDHGRRHRRYQSLKALGFLSAPHFVADSGIRARYGIPDGRLFVVRFSRHEASHDRRTVGLDAPAREALLRILLRAGHVALSVEGEPTRIHLHGSEQHDHLIEPPVRAVDFHHLLASSALCVSDSQSVAGEAAVLGVPVIRLSSFTGRTFYLSFLEEQYGLIRNFLPGEDAAFVAAVEETLNHLDRIGSAAHDAADRLLTGSEDLVDWFHALINELAHSRKRIASGRRALR